MITKPRFVSTITLALCALFAADAHGVQSPGQPVGLQTASGAQPRAIRTVSHTTPAAAQRAWLAFRTDVGGSWVASWDEATHVPLRIFGTGISAPKTVGSQAAAASFATNFLQRHIALLAPGAQATNFSLVSNVLSADMRVVAFEQMHGGMPVVGGQLSFRFKNDRLMLIASEALPFVAGQLPQTMITTAKARDLAEQWIVQDAGQAIASWSVQGPLVLPIVKRSSLGRYRVVLRVEVAAKHPVGRWTVYLDARTGQRVAREQTLRFAEATVLFNAPVRYPGDERSDYAAAMLDVDVDQLGTVSTDESGMFSFPDSETSTAVTLSPQGAKVSVKNNAGTTANAVFQVSGGDKVVWDEQGTPELDAQLSAFIHTYRAKQHGKTIAPEMNWLNAKMPVNVNINDQCNAFYDGKAINFYQSSGNCENTGRLADVVYHEYGHGFHHHAIIPGSGAFDSALSEGVSDFYSCTITGDPAMGRGFFYSKAPLRHIDPSNGEHSWPQHIHPDPHETGLIIGGALWDLRKLLMVKHGEQVGADLTNRLAYLALRTASDIPSMYPEILAADDDDGNLENGTPNVCEIIEAFGVHGLRSINVSASELSIEPPNQDGHHVSLKVEGLFSQCPEDKVEEVSLRWKLRRSPNQSYKVVMPGGPTDFAGDIPPQSEGEVVLYKVDVELNQGSKLAFPDNPADPLYQFFVGEVVPIYCTDFETDPELDGWTHGLSQGKPDEGADDWQWGTPNGNAANGDPPQAFSGTKVFGNDLGEGKFNGLYQSDKTNFANSPVVDVSGYQNVRLQYRRWLNVEDGFFDQAAIFANGQTAWINLASPYEDDATTHHRDREWRFHDIDMTDYVDSNSTLQIKFEIASDSGMNMGGWTIDDFCIVAYEGELPSEPQCGNSKVETGEGCDDGNLIPGDGCNSLCQVEEQPELPVEPNATEPLVIGSGCGCTIAGAPAERSAQALALGLLLGLAAGTRRRRRQD